MGAHFRATAGPLIQLKGDLTAILTNLEFGDILFIDEIHRLQPNIEEIQAVDHAETRTQRRRNQTCACSRTDQGKPPQVQTVRTCARSLADDDIELEILHCRIEDFFNIRLQAVDFVDEQNIPELQVRQDGGEIAFELNQWT